MMIEGKNGKIESPLLCKTEIDTYNGYGPILQREHFYF
jgi:hypothetical protein